jgi:hypothetical protein
MTRPIILILTAALSVIADPGLAGGTPTAPPIGREADVLSRFYDRVGAYLETHPDTNTFTENAPDEVASDERCSLPDVSTRVDSLPPRHGTIFTPGLDDLFRRIVARVLSPIDQGDVLRVMPLFPGGVPVRFVSPNLFRALPPLPTRLEYRFRQHDLVILDLHTGVTVDSVWMVIGPSAT